MTIVNHFNAVIWRLSNETPKILVKNNEIDF